MPSGIEHEYLCANWHADSPTPNGSCQKTGTFACGSCRLVTYCGRECQKAHWTQHKSDCQLPLIKENWVPAWITEGREPTFFGETFDYNTHFGGSEHLFGNVPAIDMLCLGDNEGAAYEKALKVLCAASGDLRNVVQSIVSLPTSYQQSVCFTINDINLSIVARNFAIAFIALRSTDGQIDETIDTMIHVWYSAFLRQGHVDFIRSQIRPVVQDICDKIHSKGPTTIIGKTWNFGPRSLRLVLTKRDWLDLLSFFDVNDALTLAHAMQVRQAVTKAPSRKDFIERRMQGWQGPLRGHRLCYRKFREDGLLLPFDSPIKEQFTTPNPTLFHRPGGARWPMSDLADPIDGWDLFEVLNAPNGPATSDRYGRFYHYLRGVFWLFLQRLSSLDLALTFLNVNAADLGQHPEVNKERFARIETSNIADGGYLGVERTLTGLYSLLQTPTENPHATMITLFMNAALEMMTETSSDELAMRKAFKPIKSYFQPPPGSTPLQRFWHVQSSAVLAMIVTQNFRDNEALFRRYMDISSFGSISQAVGLTMKKRHTIVEEWPLRLKLLHGQKGAKEEFIIVISSGHTGAERYVEWVFAAS